MVKVQSMAALVIVLISCGIFGCRGTDEEPRNQPEITAHELVGSWESVDDYDGSVRVYTFEAQGEWSYSRSEDPDPAPSEGEWSLHHNLLTMSDEYHEEDEWEVESTTETSAIVGNRLYLGGIIVRVEGTGEGLDGTWEIFEEEREEFGETGCTGYEEYRGSWTININGDSYHSADSEIEEGIECGDTFSYTGSEETRGVLRIDGDGVFSTDLESAGNPIEVEHQEERFLGYRIAPNVIRLRRSEEDDPTGGSWERQ